VELEANHWFRDSSGIINAELFTQHKAVNTGDFTGVRNATSTKIVVNGIKLIVLFNDSH